jgi:hypothetical protein
MAAKRPMIDRSGLEIHMMGACLLVWCLGQRVILSDQVTFTREFLKKPTTERILAYEFPWVVAGAVLQTGARDAVFGGVLPLTVALFHGHVLLEGGAILASSDVPRDGSHANFMAAATVPLTHRVGIAYWHWSNGNAGNNPSLNALGVSVRLRTH